jgi:hypothetical protein
MKLIEIGGAHAQILFYNLHQINKFYFGCARPHLPDKEGCPAMLMRPEKQISPLKSALLRMTDNFLARINSSSFAAAQRRRALAGLDAKQLADIGLVYADGDYRPHPDTATWRADIGVMKLQRTNSPLVPAKAGTQSQN